MQGTLLGNYRVVDQLGAGGMGVVYVGRHEQLGHRVVVKVLRPELSSNADMVGRFFNEAQAATEIHNPGIVQIFDFGTTPDGRAYFVMELLEGETLAARLKWRRLDPVECCRLGRQVANVLQAAHAAGIIHRDLKPENLFLIPDPEVIGGERVKVLDFGIAKLAGNAGVKTDTGLMMGTPDYMSPEQCRSASAADARSDIYSLGCILFEMACRRTPFGSRGLGDVVAAHLHEPPPHPQSLVPDLPPGLAALIVMMLAKRPDARPQTMTAVSHVFDSVLRALASVPAPIPVPAPTQTPHAAHPPTSRTLRSAARRFRAPRAPGRLPFVLGGLVIVSAVVAIAIVLATDRSRATDQRISYDNILAAASGMTDAADVEPAVVPPPVRPTAPVVIEDRDHKPVRTADQIEADCQRHAAARGWEAVARCADELEPLAAKRAAALKTRAAEETRSAPRIGDFEAALRDNNLKRAKAALDQIWAESVDYAKLKRAYEVAETQAITELAGQLARANSPGCTDYNQLLAKHRTVHPPRVTAEAARQAPCTSPTTCDADALSTNALNQFAANQLSESLASFDAAYACRPTPTLLQKAFVVACNLGNVAKARSYWKRLSAALRTPALGTCVRNGITEQALNAP